MPSPQREVAQGGADHGAKDAKPGSRLHMVKSRLSGGFFIYRSCVVHIGIKQSRLVLKVALIYSSNLEKLKMPSKNHRSNFINTRKTERQTPLSNALEVSYFCPQKISQDKNILMKRLNRDLAKHDRILEKQLLDGIFRNSKC